MGGLSGHKRAVLTAVVGAAPDPVLDRLDAALGMARDAQLEPVRVMIAEEREDRIVRDFAFGPFAPLFDKPASPFPRGARGPLWSAIREAAPLEVRALASAMQTDLAPPLANNLCRFSAARLAARAAPSDRSGAAEADALAACLNLAPVVREARSHVAEWLGRLTGERAAAARLAFRDAVALADDAGPLLLDILSAHLAEPWQVLRLVSAVMDRPSDVFLASSELARFGEAVLDDLDRQVEAASAFNPAMGRPSADAASQSVQVAGLQIAEFDYALQMSKAGPWALRLARQKKALASGVENRLRECPAAVAAALPLQPGLGRAARGRPRLDADPDPAKVAKAEALTAFANGVRPAAATLGFASLRNQLAEDLEASLAQYVEDLLEIVHAGDPAADRARAYLDIAARMMADVASEKDAEIVRRRAAAA